VFKNSFIPRRLDEVTHFERDAARIATGGYTEGIYYQTVTGLEADLSGVRMVPNLLQPADGAAAGAAPVTASALPDEPAALAEPAVAPKEAEAAAAAEQEDEEDEEDEESSEESEGSEEGTAAGSGDERGTPSTWAHRPGPPTREELRAQRRDNKNAVKEAQRERRKTKLPKHMKKKRVNANKK
jgi:RIO kinase 1